MRRALWLTAALVAAVACRTEPAAPGPAAPAAPPPAADAEHENVVGPHGDHSPHKGGMVLMNADIHYEVVLSRDGRHRIWFSDAVRNELPASVATGVTLTITRMGEPDEVLPLSIDDSGESWIAAGRPVTGDAYVKVAYALQGEPHEVEVPFVPATPPSTP
ncbi:MAG: hypothetical protein AB7U83_16410 [Vicinamibacterales bacterium]